MNGSRVFFVLDNKQCRFNFELGYFCRRRQQLIINMVDNCIFISRRYYEKPFARSGRTFERFGMSNIYKIDVNKRRLKIHDVLLRDLEAIIKYPYARGYQH